MEEEVTHGVKLFSLLVLRVHRLLIQPYTPVTVALTPAICDREAAVKNPPEIH